MKQQEIDKVAALIYEAPLGEYIGRDGAEILAKQVANLRTLKDNEYLYREGETTSSFYIVANGRLAIVKEKRGVGAETIVHVLEKGDLVGELSFIDQTAHTVSVRALGDASVLCFGADAIKPLITEHPVLVYNFMRAVIKRVHRVVAAIGAQQLELERYISSGGKGRL